MPPKDIISIMKDYKAGIKSKKLIMVPKSDLPTSECRKHTQLLQEFGSANSAAHDLLKTLASTDSNQKAAEAGMESEGADDDDDVAGKNGGDAAWKEVVGEYGSAGAYAEYESAVDVTDAVWEGTDHDGGVQDMVQ
jgi:hypothetical protein